MTTRAETAAATRSALLSAAAALLDDGGPDAVTLREVGARAGVSRGAPYGHFASKDELLTALAAHAWERMAVRLRDLRAQELSPEDRLRAALAAALETARNHPHLYGLMFTIPSHDPRALVAVAGAAQDEFLAIVASVTGDAEARPLGALLMSATHGIAGLDLAGHLGTPKWGVTADELVDLLVRRVTD